MRNFVQIGNTISIPAVTVAVPAGGVYLAGALIGISHNSAEIGDPVDLALVGVYELPKVGADVVALGGAVYWNATAKLVTTTASGNTKLGVAIEAAGSGIGTVKVRLAN